MLKIQPEDIEQLDARQLVELLLTLLLIESKNNRIPQSRSHVPLNINVADGGEDGRIECGGIDNSAENFLKPGLMLFQVKATNMGPAQCHKEILESSGNTLKVQVEKCLNAGATYILFYHKMLVQEGIDERIAKFREAIQKVKTKEFANEAKELDDPANKPADLAEKFANQAKIEIYDAGKISNWVNNHISAITFVLNTIGKTVPLGLKTWDEWSKYSEFKKFQFHELPSLKEHTEKAKKGFLNPQEILAIIGRPGLGKSRLALEIFKRVSSSLQESGDPRDRLCRDCVYFDAKNNTSEIIPSFNSWIRQKLTGTVIVDNCHIDLANRLVEEIKRTDSMLSLVVIFEDDKDCDRSFFPVVIDLTKNHDLFSSEYKDLVRALLKETYNHQFAEVDLDRIVTFSDGYPKIAELLAREYAQPTEFHLLSSAQIVNRLIWGKKEQNDKLQDLLQACALFAYIGVIDNVEEEYKFVAQHFAKMDPDEFYRLLMRHFASNGLVRNIGRFIAIYPEPLAWHLAAQWYNENHPTTVMRLIAEFINPQFILLKPFFERFAKLDFSPAVKATAKKLCEESSPLVVAKKSYEQSTPSNLEGMSLRGLYLQEYDNNFTRLYSKIAEVDPLSVAKLFFNLYSKNTLKAEYYVLEVLLQKLCVREESFECAASLCLKIAEKDTEKYREVTGFTHLFYNANSGTKASLSKKLEFIEKEISKCSSSEKIKKILIQALGKAIWFGSIFRSIGAEFQGYGPSLLANERVFSKEIIEYSNSALHFLLRIMKNDNEDFVMLASKEIADSLNSGFRYEGTSEILITALEGILVDLRFFLPNILESLSRIYKYSFNNLGNAIFNSLPDSMKNKLLELKSAFMPKTIRDKMLWYVNFRYSYSFDTSTGWGQPTQEEQNSYSEFIIYCQNNFEEFIGDIDSILFISEETKTYHSNRRYFAKRLTEALDITKIEQLINVVISKINAKHDADLEFLAGLLVVLQARGKQELLLTGENPDLNKIISYVFSQKLWGEDEINIICQLVGEHKVTLGSFIFFIDTCSSREQSTVLLNRFLTYMPDSTRLVYELVKRLPNIVFENLDEITKSFIRTENLFIEKKGILKTITDLSLIILSDQKENTQQARLSLVDFLTRQIGSLFSSEDFYGDYFELFFDLQKLLFEKENYRNIYWPFLKEKLTSEDSKAASEAKFFVFHNFYRGYSPISVLPEQLLFDWCTENPEKAPLVLAENMNLIAKSSITWSPLGKYLISNFFHNAEIVRKIHMNLGNCTWSGSTVDFYQKRIDLYRSLLNENNPTLIRWASQEIENYEVEITAERKQEAEQNKGIYADNNQSMFKRSRSDLADETGDDARNVRRREGSP